MGRKRTTDQFIKEAIEIHGNKYDYSEVIYESAHTEVTINCPYHGAFKQVAREHLRGHGCFKCTFLYKDTNQFIEEAQEIHGDVYDYSEVEYINHSIPVCIICFNHGAFRQLPSNHLNGSGCPECANELRRKTTDQFIEEAIQVHGDKYDYSQVEYIKDDIKVCIICPIHGVIWQTPGSHLSGCGCFICSGQQQLTTEQFIKEAIEVHGDKYDYSEVEYLDMHTKVQIRCPYHGTFKQVAKDHLKGCGCKKCSDEKTSAYNLEWIKNNPEQKDNYGVLYLIEMYNNYESFLKIGVTKNTVDKRYKNLNEYSYQVISKIDTTLEEAILLEDQIKNDSNLVKKWPKEWFGGFTECFKLESYDDLMQYF